MRRNQVAVGVVLLVVAVLLPSTATVAVPAGTPPERVSGPDLLAEQTPPPGPALYDEAVLADDPLVHYRLDDASGPAVDASGNGRTGTYAATATRSVTGALLDDASTAARTTVSGSQVIDASDAGLPIGSADRTVEVWAKTVSSGRPIVDYGTFELKLDGTSTLRVVVDADTGVNFALPQPATADRWAHYVVTLSSTGEVIAYLDGQRLGQHVDPAITTALDGVLAIGDGIGDYDEAAIYDTVLPPARVLEHFHRGVTRVAHEACPADPEVLAPTDPYGEAVLADGPLSYLRLGDAPQGADERISYDVSGACRHGALSTGVTRTGSAVDGGDGALTQTGSVAGRWAVVQSAGTVTAGASPMTVEMWSTTAHASRWLFTMGTRYGLYIDSATTGRWIPGTVSGSEMAFTLPRPLVAGVWHHWAVTFDGDRFSVYFDGVEVTSRSGYSSTPGAIAVSDPGAPIRIGGGDGAFDEMAVYPSALGPVAVAGRWALGQDGVSTCPTATGAYAAEVLADAPAAYYRMGERGTDPAARVMRDSSGACRHGAYAADAVGASGGALATGADGAVGSAGTAANGWAGYATGSWLPTGSQPLTLEAWARGTTTGRWTARYGNRFGFYYGSNTELRFYYGGTDQLVSAPLPHPVLDDEWHHIAATYDGTVLTAVFDGVVVARGTVTPQTTPHGDELVVGEAGRVDEVAVYPTALSPARLRAHWSVGRSSDAADCRPGSTSGHAQAVLDDGPLSYWRLGDVDEGGTGQVAFDSTTACRNGSYAPDASAAGTVALAGDPDGAMTAAGAGAERWAMSTGVEGFPVGTDPVSFEVWSTTTATGRWLFRYGNRVGLYLASATVLRLYWGPGTTQNVAASITPLGGTWHHFAFTYDGSAVRIYVNGFETELEFGITLSSVQPDGELRIGEGAGSYDEAAVYDRVLSQSEISARVANKYRVDTTTTIDVPSEEWVADHDLDVEVEVDTGDGGATTASGTVTVWEGTTALGTGTLEPDGTATVPVQVGPGPRELTASYAGSATHSASRSGFVTGEAVVRYDTATELVVDPSPAVPDQAPVATITVTEAQPGPGTPAGDVELLVDDEVVGTAALDGAGRAVVALPELAVGDHEVVARYGGQGDHLGSQDTVEHEVVLGTAAVTVDVPETLPWSAPLELAVDVAPVAPATSTPTGTVEVEVDGEPAGSAPLVDGTAVIEVEDLELGSHEVEVSYGGSSTFAADAVAPQEVEVVPATAAVAVTADPAPSAEGADVEVTATLTPVAPATATPEGFVRLYDGIRLLGTVAAVDGVATVTVDDLDRGPHVLRAVLVATAHWATSTGEATHHVRLGSTTTVDPIADTVRGQGVVVSVRVASSSPGGPGPTGTVVVLDEEDEEVGSGTLDGSGRAEITVAGLSAGTEDLVAVYAGDDRHAGSTSAPETATVGKAASHVSLTATPNPSAVDADVVLVADVVAVAPGAGTPTGSVAFMAEGDPTPLATATLGPTGAATATVSFDAVGATALTAVYDGDDEFTGRTSAVVTHHVEPATELVLVAAPTTLTYGEDLELTATVTATGATPTGTVTFSRGDEVLGTEELDGSGEAVLVVDDLPAGAHDVVAEYAGQAFGPSSDEVAVEVGAAATTVDVEVVEGTTSAYGTAVTATATIAATGIDPEEVVGPVAFAVDGDPVATVTAEDGEASVVLEDLDVGEHEVTASYGGRPDGDLAAGSGAVDHEVEEAPTSVVLEAPEGPVAVGADVRLEATVARTTDGGTEDPTGTVTFTATGVGPLGSAPLVDGVAVLTTDDLATVGPWEITAAYAGDSRHLPATSDPGEWTVLAAVTVAVTPPGSATDLGDPAAFAVSVTPAVPGAVPTGTVELREQGGRLLATATLDGSGAATLTTTAILGGATALVVRYGGDATYAPAGSDPFVHVVTEGAATLALDAAPDPVAAGHPVAVVATVTGPVPGIRPTGTVRFELPSGAIRDVALDRDGRAVTRIADLAVGTHEIEVVYLGDRSHDPSTPGTVEVEVVTAPELGVTVTPDEGTVGLEVTAAVTGSPGAATLTWDFGDGGTGSGPSATHTYAEAGLYTVTLAAELGGATSYATARVEVGEDAPLVAAAGADQVVADGVAALLDGRSSTPIPGIDTWLWDLGDGTTSDEPTFSHVYDEPGTYGVRLTVTRDGVTATDETTVTVEEVGPDEGLHVTVLGTDGPLAGADVLVIDAGTREFRGATGEDGTTVLAGLANSTYSVYAIAEGYRPEMVTASVADGYGTAEVTLEAGARAITEVAATQLTTEEIVAAGLDPNDPANSRVWDLEIWLDFVKVIPEPADTGGGGGEGRRLLLNDDGFLGPWDCPATTCHIELPDGNGLWGRFDAGLPGDRPTLTWIVMPARAQWLKEVFEVQLVVQNLTDPDFAFEDGAAVLDPPPGTSLAGLTEPQDRIVEMDDIVGGSAGSARWILRGDEAGTYDVGASYTASLYPLGTGVQLQGVAPDGLVVRGADALEMEVRADDTALQYSPYLVDVEITNVSDIDVHNLTFELFDGGTQGFIYQPRQRHRFLADALAPGESLVAEAVLVPNAFSGQVETEQEGDLDLEDSFVRTLGGTDTMPATIVEQPHLPRAERPTLCGAGFHTDENGVCSSTSRDEDEEWKDRGQPLGEVVLTWEPTGGTYRLYRTDSPTTPFPRDPIVETTATSYRYSVPVGQEGFYAVTTVGPDGEEMLHNAVVAAPGDRSSANLRVSVACDVEGTYIDFKYEDNWFAMEQFRVVTDFTDTGEVASEDLVGGGPLQGMSGSEQYRLPSSLFEGGGDHIQEMPTDDGEMVPIASIFVQVKNVNDGIWSEPVPAVVFPTCLSDIAAIPAEQTFGTGCKTEEYFGQANLAGANTTRCAADPVNTATGSLVAHSADLALPGLGESFALERTYNSADETVGPLGRGWTHPYDESLTFPEPGVIVHRVGDGQQVVFQEHEDDPRPGDWFLARTSDTEIERTPVPIECGGCTYILRRKDRTFAHFDAAGHLLEVRDRNDNGLVFENDPSGRPLTATDAGGRVITFTYRTDGLLERVATPDGRDVTYGYTGGLLTSATDPRGAETLYRYAGGLLVEETSPNGERVHLTEYDAATGRVVRQEDGTGAVTTFAWDPVTEISTMTDAAGMTWIEDYEGNVLRSTTDPLGRTRRFTYDLSLNVTQIVEADGSRSTMSYDAAGNLVRSQGPAPLSLVDTYTYDEANDRTSWTAPDGRVTTYSYDTLYRAEGIDGPGAADATSSTDGEGLVEWTENGLGQRTSYEYDDHGNQTSSCTELGHCTTRTYDAAGRLRTVVGPLGNVDGADPLDHTVRFDYDEAGNRTGETDPLGRTATYWYDSNGNVWLTEEPDGRTVLRAFDAAGQLVRESIEGAPQTEYEYDGRGLMTRRTSPEGRVTRWEYDAVGRMAAMVDGEGGRWTYGYDDMDRPISTRDPAGGVHELEYDAAGRVIREISPTGGVTTYAYDRAGRVVRVTDPTGATTRTTYDVEGNVATIEDPAGGVTELDHDAAGNLVRTTAPTGEVTETVYDEDGRVEATVGPLAFSGGVREEHTTHLELDAAGNVRTITDPLDRVVESTYDPLGRLLSRTAPGGRTTSYTYDEVGRVETVTTPDEEVTEWEYNTSGDLLVRRQPDGGETTYTYDDDHLQLTETDPLDRTWRVAHDDNGRVTSTWDAIATAAGPEAPPTSVSRYDARGLLTELAYTDPGTADIRYTYDLAGRVATVTDGVGVQTHGYDAAGRLLESRRGTDVFTYRYDAAGRPRSTTYPDGTVVDETYDPNGRLATVSAFGERTTYGYDGGGRLEETRFPNGVLEQLDHDALGRFTSSTTTRGLDVVTYQVRTYDEDGDVATDVTPAGTHTYAHDDRERLTDVCVDTCPTAPTTTYRYDEAGNRIEEEADGATVVEATYDEADQTEVHSPAGGPVEALLHDGNGSVVDDGVRSYRYDAAGRLVEVRVSEPGTPTASITGTVTDPADQPVEGVVVRAYADGREVGTATTSAAGGYTLDDLPTGEYDVLFDTVDQGGHVLRWHGGTSDPASSVPVAVTFGTPTTDVDAELLAQPAEAVLSGVVVDEVGDPIAGARTTVSSITPARSAGIAESSGFPVPGEPAMAGLSVRARLDGEWIRGGRLPVRAGVATTIGIEVVNTGLVDLGGVVVGGTSGTPACPVDDGDRVIDELAVGQTVTCTITITPTLGAATSVVDAWAEGETVEDTVRYLGYGACTINGTSGPDHLIGTTGPDVICGLGSHDELEGGGGNDVLLGGAGPDIYYGGPGDDVIDDRSLEGGSADGGDGADLVRFGGGYDFAIGGDGDDTLYGGAGEDRLHAGPDGARLFGGEDVDYLYGGVDEDLLWDEGLGDQLTGSSGDDVVRSGGDATITAGDGNDTVTVTAGSASTISGGAGEDVVLSGTGADTITGGADADVMLGSGGADTFPSAAAEDSVVHEDYVASTTTDADGRWTMRVPAGIYSATTSAPGFLAEGYDGTTWQPAAEDLVVWKVREAELAVDLMSDPSWVEPPDHGDPDLGEPGEVLARYTYDAAGNRTSATTAEGTTRYTWDTSSGLARLVTTSGAQGDRTVVWGATGPLSVRERGEDPVFLHTDAIGSVTAVTDAEGAVVGRGTYDPFGRLRGADGGEGPLVEGSDLFGFAGEQYDAGTGLYYLRARYYDPAWGRFTQPDPLGPEAGAGHESTYLYASGSPLSSVDPTGLRDAKADSVRMQNEAIFAAERAERADAKPLWEKIDDWANDLSLWEGLDLVAGFTPLGVVLDLGRAAIAAARGKWGEAALYALAAAPGLGEVMKGAKVARATRNIDEIADAGRAVSRASDDVVDVGKAVKRARPDFPTVRPRGTGAPISHHATGRPNVGADDFWSNPERGSAALPGGGGGKGAGPPAARPDAGGGDDFVDLATPERRAHILTGNKTGGGHMWPGLPGKTPFPASWSADRIMHEISDIATDPAAWARAEAQGVKSVLHGMRDGVEIKVVVITKTGHIVTGHPTNLPRNPW